MSSLGLPLCRLLFILPFACLSYCCAAANYYCLLTIFLPLQNNAYPSLFHVALCLFVFAFLALLILIFLLLPIAANNPAHIFS